VKRVAVVALFYLFVATATAQNISPARDSIILTRPDQALVDLILPLYRSAEVDTTRITLLSRLVSGLRNKTLANRYNDTLTRIVYNAMHESRSDAAKLKRLKHFHAASLNAHGVRLANSGDAVQSIDSFRRALAIREELGDSSGTAAVLNNLGRMYTSIGEIQRALEHYNRSLGIKERSNDKRGIAVTLNNIGVVYHDVGDTAEAYSFFRRSMALREELRDTAGLITALNNFGSMHLGQRHYDQALSHYERSLALSERLGLTQPTGTALSNIGVIYNHRKQYDTARIFLNRARIVFEKSGDAEGETQTWQNLGIGYLAQGNTAKAVECGERSLSIAQRLGYPLRIEKAAALLEDAYKARNDWQRAFEMKALATTMRDSLANAEARKQLLQQRYRHEYETKTAVLNAAHEAELRRQRLLQNTLVGGLVFALLVVGLIVWALRQSMRHRRAIAAEKQRTDALLRNILPAETADELKQHGAVKAKHYESATVLFTDFVDFAKLAAQLPAQQTVAMIDAYYRAFDEIVEQHGIEKIKTIGDSYMAVGGVPAAAKDHALRTVRAAIALRDFVEAESIQRSQQNLPAFHIRIGVHSGPVVAGVVGARKFAYDVWGDTVNLAARMEQSGVQGMVNISAATYNLVKENIVCTYRGSVEVKHGALVEMYFAERDVSLTPEASATTTVREASN